jgi:methyl-accepting chemotaxis protein
MNKNTIRNRILIYVIASGSLTLFLYSLANYFSQRQQVETSLRELALLTTENLGLQIQADFYQYKTMAEVLAAKEDVIAFVRGQKDRRISAVRRNPRLPLVLAHFAEARQQMPEAFDIFLGLSNTGNYISLKYEVYDDQAYDCRQRDWYINAENATGFVAGTIGYDYGDSSTSVNCMYPLRIDDQLYALLGIDIRTDFVREKIETLRFGQSGRAFLVMQDKQLFAFPGLDFAIGRYVENLDTLLTGASGFASLSESLWQNPEGTASVLIDGESHHVFYSSLGLLNWKLGIIVPDSEIMQPLHDLVWRVLLFFVIGLALMFAAAYIIARPIVKPVTELAERFDVLARSEGDLTQQLNVRSQGELGHLAAGFNAFLANIREIVQTIKYRTKNIDNSMLEVLEGSEAMHGNANKVSRQTSEIASATKELSQSIKQITANAKAMEQSISESAQAVASSSDDIERFIAGADDLVSNVQRISEALSGLGKFSEEIQATIAFIDDIADRVSLLALNASIEAASAGEHGYGFQVVANEVKGLSEKIFDQTSDTKKALRSLVTAISETQLSLSQLSDKAGAEVEHSQKAKEAITAMEAAIENANSSILEISSEAEEQANSTEMISRSIEDIAQNNRGFIDSIKSMDGNMKNIEKMVNELRQQIDKFNS